jgi:hypothetical protein
LRHCCTPIDAITENQLCHGRFLRDDQRGRNQRPGIDMTGENGDFVYQRTNTGNALTVLTTLPLRLSAPRR